MNKKQYIVIEDNSPSSGMFCLGIFDDIDKAFGVALKHIWSLQESFEEPDDKFTYTAPYIMDGNGGYAIKVDYKAADWEKDNTCYYYIIFGDES